LANGIVPLPARQGVEAKQSWRSDKMSSTQVVESIDERFHELRDDWKSKTRHLSNTAQISLVFSYQKIIGMGPAVVPMILSELEKEPDHWFWALEAITDENPVAESDAGDIEASARVWVQWGRDKGLLAK
jgi:hypothetical protein